MSGVKMRRHVEKVIARRVILDLLHAGFTLNVNCGDEDDELPEPSNKAKTVLDAMFAADEDWLLVFQDGKRIGWVYFVYGNDGWDVVSDYTVNLESHMAGANTLADKYGG